MVLPRDRTMSDDAGPLPVLERRLEPSALGQLVGIAGSRQGTEAGDEGSAILSQ